MSGIFSKPKMPEAPAAPEPVKPMPVPDDAAMQDAKKRATQIQRRRKGRASTILTAAGDVGTLGE